MVLVGSLSAVLLFLLTPFPCYSSAAETLRSGDTLAGNATLVSAGKIFEFGFFRASHRTDRVYLGIWYHNITPQVVVWIANRDAPFSNSSGQIELSPDGNLNVRLEDGSGKQAWSTGLASVWNSNSTATLRDDGNLVIRSEGGTGPERWRSFDHPTDTLLPGMKISLDRVTGNATKFTSWLSTTDPASGNYTLGLDPRVARQLVMVDKSSGRIRWRSGLWTVNGFNGVNRMRPLFEYGFQLTVDPDQTNMLNLDFTYINSTKMRFLLQPNGTEITYVYEDGRWKNIWQQPMSECEFYNHCGANAMCDESAKPKCSCFRGFEPKLGTEWEMGNWTRGCVRRTPLKAQRNESDGGEDDGFLSLQWIKLPDAAEWDSVATDVNGCAANCAANRSCTAYALLNGQGCFRWTGDLLDVFRFSDESNGGELFLRLAGSELDNHKNKSRLAVIIIPTAVGAILLISCIFLWLRYKTRIKEAMPKRQGRVENLATETGTSDGQHDSTRTALEIDEIHSERKPFELPMFSFELIEAATENFNEANELGKGGFGYVYKGKLPWGEEIAVKRLSRDSGQGHEEFKNEMTVIAKLQHVNLVRLLGCCIRGEEKILIYEYMPNKSLDAFIFDKEMQRLLDWKVRFNIIEGIARGLLYLHRDSRLRIVHRDLKASNILLDHDMNPKISDFGMARIFGSNQNHEETNHVVGTFGYMSPEYAMEGLFSVKSDVYSFGVLLLEIITGKRNSRCRSEEYHSLLGYAWQMWEGDQGLDLVDPSIRESCSPEEVLRCVHTALLCVQDRANDRPTMSSVVIMLGTETKILARPKRPTFANVAGSPSRTTAQDDFSENNVTITVLNGR